MRNHKLRNTNVIFFCIKCKKSSVASQGKRIINVFSIKLAFWTRFPGSKSRNNALHADCCKVTIELSAHAVATIRVFLPQEPFLRANFT